MLSPRYITVGILFFVGMLEVCTFYLLQYPSNFYINALPQKLVIHHSFFLSITTVVAAAFTYLLTRKWGLKKVLIRGLYLYLIGLSILLCAHLFQGNKEAIIAIIFSGTFLFGIAFSTVAITLITYVILEFPKHIGMGLIVLMVFYNLGAMLSPILLNIFDTWEKGLILSAIIAVLMLTIIRLIRNIFFDPSLSKDVKHLRKGSLIWKEMHYRFALFILCMFFYGICENTFNIWGELRMLEWVSSHLANDAIMIFWLFLVIGQVIIILPLHHFSMHRIIYFIIGIMAASLIYLPFQKTFPSFINGLAIGGIGCSACIPILLSMIEMEIADLIHDDTERLPYLEISVSMMVAAYFLGSSIIVIASGLDLSVTEIGISNYFFGAAGAAFLMLILIYYLVKTSLRRRFDI